MSLMLYGFNVVLQRKSFDRVIKGGSASFIKRTMDPSHGAVSVTSGDHLHLVAVRFSPPWLLEILVKNLLRHTLQCLPMESSPTSR
jgi:hypothetical protein